jgi:hypothetical protein
MKIDVNLDNVIAQMNTKLREEHKVGIAVSSAIHSELEIEHNKKPFTPSTLYMYLTGDRKRRK